MSKIISQEAFDDVVRENMENFDMTEEEAIKDVIEEFKVQKVNMVNIISSPAKVKEIIACVEELKDLSTASDVRNAGEAFKKFTNVVKEGLNYRVFAAKKGAYSYLISSLKKAPEECKVDGIMALAELMDGYPDLLDPEGQEIMLNCFEGDSADMAIAGCRLLEVSVKKHEENRVSLFKADVADKLRQSIERWPENKDLTSKVCEVVLNLIQDDDIRVVHGNAHEHARAVASKLLPVLTSTLSRFLSDTSVSTAIMSALTGMIVRNELCIQFHELGGIQHVLDVMRDFGGDSKLARECFRLLKALAGSDEVKEPIIAAGAAPLLVSFIEAPWVNKDKNALRDGFNCLAALSLRSPKNSRALCEAGCAEVLVNCMNNSQSDASIITHGSAVIRNQISHCPDLKDEYVRLELPQLLLAIQSRPGAEPLDFHSKNVLVGLGCDVKLTEEWRGTGVQLEN